MSVKGDIVRLAARNAWDEVEQTCREDQANTHADPTTAHYLGKALRHTGRAREAIKPLWRAARARVEEGESWSELGHALKELGRSHSALRAFQRAVASDPNNGQAHLATGRSLQDLNRSKQAVVHLEQAARLMPDDAIVHYTYAQALRSLDRLEEALIEAETAVALRPHIADLHVQTAGIYGDLGDLTGHLASLRKAVQLGAGPAPHSNLVFAIHYAPATTPVLAYAEARRWAAKYADPLTDGVQAPEYEPVPGRKLRVGYLSADLRNHPVGRLLEPVLRWHDRGVVEVYFYNDARSSDPLTNYLRSVPDHWRDTAALTDVELADRIREDKIDILVEATGHFGRCRLTALAGRPAPIQVNAFGYCGTTGCAAIDYRITDVWSDPHGVGDAYHTERLLRLPNTSFCYRPFETTPDVGPLPALITGGVTFGNFNNPIKTTDGVVSLWSRLLQAVPDSRLMLLCRPAAESRQRARFAVHGIGEDRIVFVRPTDRWGYLNRYNEVDLALDPFPFNGDNTTADALWMGVPVLSIIGSSFAGRRGLSLLTNVGLADLAVLDEDSLIVRTQELVGDLDALQQLRYRLRDRVWRSPLADAGQFVKHLEAAYMQMSIARRESDSSTHPFG